MKKIIVLLLSALFLFAIGCGVGSHTKEERESMSGNSAATVTTESSPDISEIIASDESEKSSQQSTESTVEASDSQDSDSASTEVLEDKLIEFDVNGGRLLPSVRTGGKITELPIPYKYGYEFLGWYENDDFSGEGIFGQYLARQDVCLHAKWQLNPEIVYVYLYAGEDNFEETILTYKKGDQVKVADFFTPSALMVDGVACPFVGWFNEVHNPTVLDQNFGDKTTDFVITEDRCIIAKYNMSAVPLKSRIIDNGDGTWTTSGNVIYSFATGSSSRGVFSCKLIVNKVEGQVGVAFRMTRSNIDYAYEQEGNSYYDVVIRAADGGMGIYQTWAANQTAWARVQPDIPLTSLPASWQEKFNSNIQLEFTMTVVSYDDYFEIYLDNELAYTSSVEMYLNGHDFGIRSNISGVIVSDISFRDNLSPVNVSFESNGGTACSNRKYFIGKMNLPTPTKDDMYFTGWFYDEQLSRPVEIESFTPDSDIILYAGWSPFYTVSLNENGGDEIDDLIYVINSKKPVILPVAQKANSYFLGWFDNPGLTGEALSGEYVPQGDTVLYASWSAYYTVSFNENGGEEIDDMFYVSAFGTPITLPTIGKENQIFLGWFDNPELTGTALSGELTPLNDMTLYAGWRDVVNTNVTDNGGGSYTSKGPASMVLTSASGSNLKYTLSLNFTKAIGGSGGIIFRADINEDNAFQASCKFLAVSIAAANGSLQISATTPEKSFAHLVSPTALASLPSSWQTKYNGVTSDTETISVTLCVIDYGTYFEVYIDDVLAKKVEVDISDFTNTGIGFRASKAGYTIRNCTVETLGASTGKFASKSNNFADITALIYRNNESITFFFTGTRMLNGNCEVFIDVGNFASARNEKNISFVLQDNGGIGVSYYPNGTATSISDKNGLVWTIYGNSAEGFTAKFTVTYEYLTRVLGQTVNLNSKIAFSLGQWSTTANDWDGWGFNGEFVAPEVPSKYVVISADNKLS